MENQVSEQLAVFAQSILLGFGAGVLYDLLRPFRLRFPRLTAVLDSVYCLILGLTAFLFMFYRSAGEMRGYVVLGAGGGAVLYFCGCAPLLRPVWEFWADSLVRLGWLLAVTMRLARRFVKKIAAHAKNLFYFIIDSVIYLGI